MNSKSLYFLTLLFFLASVGVLFFLLTRGINRSQNAAPSKAAEVDPDKCQGNKNPPPKCFKCEAGSGKNNPVGMLDFSCFAKVYGQNVGKP